VRPVRPFSHVPGYPDVTPTFQVPRESIEVGSEAIDVAADEATDEERERLFAIGAERIPQLAGDPGRHVGKRPGVGDGAGVTAGAAVSSGGVKTILDEGVHDESVCCRSDGGNW
jgi:hypothetical protein